MKALRQEAKASHDAKVGRMLGRKGGGFVPPEVGSEDRLPGKNVITTKHAGKIEGQKARSRLDRPAFAAGGRASGKATTVNVIVSPKDEGANAPPPMPPPMPPAMPPPMPPPHPPMLPPGAGPPGGMPPPGGLPVRAKGGRVKRADGGGVDQQTSQQERANTFPNPYNDRMNQPPRKAGGGAVANKHMKAGTKVSHDPGKGDTDEIFPERAPRLPKARGGRAYPIDDGAGGGLGRLEKIGKHT